MRINAAITAQNNLAGTVENVRFENIRAENIRRLPIAKVFLSKVEAVRTGLRRTGVTVPRRASYHSSIRQENSRVLGDRRLTRLQNES
jgi:hypothetical protein